MALKNLRILFDQDQYFNSQSKQPFRVGVGYIFFLEGQTDKVKTIKDKVLMSEIQHETNKVLKPILQFG